MIAGKQKGWGICIGEHLQLLVFCRTSRRRSVPNRSRVTLQNIWYTLMHRNAPAHLVRWFESIAPCLVTFNRRAIFRLNIFNLRSNSLRLYNVALKYTSVFQRIYMYIICFHKSMCLMIRVLLTWIIAISKSRCQKFAHIATAVWRLSYVTSRRRAKSFSESQRKLALIANQEDVLISGANRRPALTHARNLRY